ncbi:MAG: hypothetical protein OXT09_14490 [Myxococcales bacterium]|nr:hypothetical protein [Myxococcales bacterium]
MMALALVAFVGCGDDSAPEMIEDPEPDAGDGTRDDDGDAPAPDGGTGNDGDVEDAGTVAVDAGPPPPPPNVAPVAEAGGSQVVREGEEVLLTGSGSDSDGRIEGTSWSQVAGPEVTPSTDGDEARFDAPAVGEVAQLVFSFEVVDDDGASDSDDVTVTVVPELSPPSVEAGDDRRVDEGVTVELAGTAADADGTIEDQLWTQRAGPAVTLDTSGADASFSAPAVLEPTAITFAFAATDDDGLVAEDTVTVTVLPVNAAPVVDAGLDFNANEDTLAMVTATASDPDGSVAELAWEQIGGPEVTLGDADTLVVSFTTPVLTEAAGIVLQLTATDNEGASSSDAVVVTVDPNNLAPSADAGPTQDPVEELTTVQLDGTASDADGTFSVEWRQLFGTSVSFQADLLDPTFEAPDVDFPQTLRFELVVTDNEGAVALDQVDIVVWPAAGINVAPEVFAGVDQVVTGGTTVALVGAANDPDGSVVSQIWTELSPAGVTIMDDTTLTPSFVAPSVPCATHVVLELEAQDDDGGVSSDQVAILILEDAASPVPLPLSLDLEADDGGIHTGGVLGDEWAWGVPTTGPAAAHTGTRVWATNPTGNYRNNAAEWLCLPPVDLGGVDDATLSFRLRLQASTSDGLRLQAQDPEAGWVDVTAVTPAYDAAVRWQDQGYFADYQLVVAAVPDWVGDVAQLRLQFESNATSVAPGAYIDDIRIDDESSDPDSDGLVGVLAEVEGHGTDPFVADTDQDGQDDGAEVGAGTDPLNGASVSTATPITPGTLLDFEGGDDGGLVPGGVLWEHGTPGSGPGAAYSGTGLWATALEGAYFIDAREYLYLPPIDLTAAGGDATLSFRLWASSAAGDGMGIEYHDGSDWQLLPVDVPGYDGTDPTGQQAFVNQRYLSDYVLVATSLAGFDGSVVQLRFSFRSRCCGTGDGAYVDDLRVDLESSDPDGDGIDGVLAELADPGSDPFVADTDGDGADDGAEVLAGSDPLIPASTPGVTPLVPGDYLPLELDDGGLASDGGLWEHGTVQSGPGGGHLPGEGNAWATDLADPYFIDAREFLYLPPLDLTGASDPTLSFRLWSRTSSEDGVSLEIRSAGGDWLALTPDTPEYGTTDAIGAPAWGTLGYLDNYVFAAVNLVAYAGEQVELRLVLRSRCCGAGAGAFIDEIRLDEEADDPDDDGIAGVLAEYLVVGSDPYEADTDGDGESDGDEVDMGGNPLNAAVQSTTVALTVGSFLDFEADDGGLFSDGGLWEHGDIASGPGSGYGDLRGWATDLDANYFIDAVEYLYLPPIDLAAATAPTLSFRYWGRLAGGDGFSIERLDDTLGWVQLPIDTPAYDATDPSGVQALGTHGYLQDWVMVASSLAGYVDEVVELRFVLRTECCGTGAGAFIDHLRIDEEGEDHDADGIDGVLSELTADDPTDPYETDTDADGVDDGAEVAGGSDPTVGADYVGGPLWTPGFSNDLETDDAGLWTDGGLWEYGAPQTGPCSGSCVAHTGSRVWATDLDANYFIDAREFLYLPPLDLSAAVSPTLDLYAWCASASGDGMSIEVKDPAQGWVNLATVSPAYDASDGAGFSAWEDLGSGTTYDPISVDLSAWSGGGNDRVLLRLTYRTRCCGTAAGCYLDDISVN